ncbi:MAG: toprim domain-containing protein [Lysinibacillus sp.]
MLNGKCLIVEGRSDKLRIAPIINEAVEIICTNGTIGVNQLEELLEPFEDYELYTFFDADASGDKLRALMNRHFPEAQHLRTLPTYKEVETTPNRVLASILLKAHFSIHKQFIL